MQDLTLVGVHEDGEHVLLVTTDGQRFRLRVDEALRAAVRRDRPRLGQLQIEMEGRLRPRDIQAQIRAGHSAAEVAEAAGLPVEHVRRYEGPVLAEREHIATQARKVVLRRGAGGGSPTLADLVTERLARREVAPASVTWDAWRTGDASWTVRVAFVAGSRERHATWSYDPRVRHVSALDDEARWLTEPEREDGGPLPQRRLSPVRDVGATDPALTVDLTEAGVGADPATVDVVDLTDSGHSGDPGEPSPDAEDTPATTVDLLDTLRARRGRRNRPAPPTGDDPGGDPLEDLLGSLLTRADDDAGSACPEPFNDPGPNHPARRAKSAKAARGSIGVPDEPHSPAAPTAADLPDAVGERPAARAKSRRASVPSWDDIVFGARRE